MRKFTASQKAAGEMACRSLSPKAKEFYIGSDPIDVYEVNDRYFVRGFFDEDDLTFGDLDALFSELQSQVEEASEEDDD